jgi:hypothetical protein
MGVFQRRIVGAEEGNNASVESGQKSVVEYKKCCFLSFTSKIALLFLYLIRKFEKHPLFFDGKFKKNVWVRNA